MKKLLLFLSAYTIGFGSYLDFKMTIYEQPSKKSAKIIKMSLRDVLLSFVEEKKYVPGYPFFWYKIDKGWVNTAYFSKDPVKEKSPIYQEEKQHYIQKQILVKQSQENAQKSTQKSNDYEQAKLLFVNKKYTQAYEAFYKLFENNMQDPNINFYLGQSAYMLQNYEIAISAYERVLNVDPNSVRSKLEIAKCYFALKDYKNSKITFLEALQENVPPNVKQNIQLYLKAIDDKTQKHFFNGSAVVGINYDTNINNRANDDTFVIPGIVDSITNKPIQTTNSVADESGFAHQEALSLNYLYSYSEDVKFKNDFVFFAKTLFKTHLKDIGLMQYSPAVSIVYNNKILVDYALLLNQIWVNSKAFMVNVGINPKVQYVYSPTRILGGSFLYQKKFLDTVVSEIDALEFTVRELYSEKLSFFLYTQLYKEKKLSGSLTNVDYDMLNISLNTSYKFLPTLVVSPKFQWQNKMFKEEDLFYLKTQKDNEYQFLLNSTYAYSKNLLFSLDYSYTKHTSNIQSWEFNKQAVTTNVIALF